MVPSEIEEIRDLVDRELDRRLPPGDEEPASLHQAMRYSVFAGGKRLRPAMVILASRACGGSDTGALPAACALEIIHTYSLIHDDLPAMDDDDMRRGKPTCHKRFGEAVAILAGDALLTLAFEISAPVPAAVAEIAAAAGAAGMIAGQVADLDAEGTSDVLPAEDLRERIRYIHMHKTAALIRCSARTGAISARAPADQLAALSRYGECVGLAFQIVDDILDVTGNEKEMGKAVRKDIERGKLIYPAVFGLEESRARAGELTEEAQRSLSIFGDGADPLRELARFVLERSS